MSRFHYGDKVRILKGIHEGEVGEVHSTIGFWFLREWLLAIYQDGRWIDSDWVRDYNVVPAEILLPQIDPPKPPRRRFRLRLFIDYEEEGQQGG